MTGSPKAQVTLLPALLGAATGLAACELIRRLLHPSIDTFAPAFTYGLGFVLVYLFTLRTVFPQQLTEIVANGHADRVHIGLDYFDASINRIAAWVIGTRNMLRALLIALLEPPDIRAAERAGDNTARLALQEEARTLPVGAVWDYYCETKGVPVGESWLAEVKRYERKVLLNR